MISQGGIWRSERGSMLVACFVIIGLVAFLFTLAMDRTVAERGLIQGFYYDQVALDLAEGGIHLAIAALQKGTAGSPGSLDFGEFRNLRGSVQTTVTSSEGGSRIVSKAVLKDRAGRERYGKQVVVSGRMVSSASGRLFRIESWQEPTQP